MKIAVLLIIVYVAVFIAYCERAYQRFAKALGFETDHEPPATAPHRVKIAKDQSQYQP